MPPIALLRTPHHVHRSPGAIMQALLFVDAQTTFPFKISIPSAAAVACPSIFGMPLLYSCIEALTCCHMQASGVIYMLHCVTKD